MAKRRVKKKGGGRQYGLGRRKGMSANEKGKV